MRVSASAPACQILEFFVRIATSVLFGFRNKIGDFARLP
jgi:hypothetical protein